MKKFETDRIVNFNLETKLFKHSIPIVSVKPLNETQDTCVFIFNSGLGGTNTLSLYMNYFAFDNNYFVSYEKMGHGNNLNKPQQYKGKFLKELDCVVEWVKKELPNKKIYLLGESWGCAINLLYLKKYYGKIAGVINWNMPTRIKPPKSLSFKAAWSSAWKEVFTFLFNTELVLPLNENMHKDLTTDPLLLRAIAMFPKARRSSRLAIAVWRYMLPSYLFLLRNGKKEKYKYLYIQSGQDALMTKKHIKKIEAKSDANHFIKLPNGYHILSMDPNYSDQLYKLILEFVGQKKN